MYERDTRIHTVVTSGGAGYFTYHDFVKAKIVNNIFLPEIRTFGHTYSYTLSDHVYVKYFV